MQEQRIHFIFLLFFIFSLVVFWRLYVLQIKNGEYWQAIALGQQVSFEEEKGERGEIFLAGGEKVLAQNAEKFVAYIFPSKIPLQKKEEVAAILGEIFNLEKETILAEINNGKVLKREISEGQNQRLAQEKLEAVSIEKIEVRFYPHENFASHLLGFVNRDGEGQYGIEGYYNEVLQGKQGFQQQEKAFSGYLTLMGEENFSQPEPGVTLVLTLDYDIQYFAEKLLKAAQEKWKIASGEILILEPQTGKVRAIATWPRFNPNEYFKETDFKIFQNETVQKLFEPGSVFKPFTMAAGLQEKVVAPETSFVDKGFVETSGPPIYNYKKRVWGEVTMSDVLKFSINTGAVFVQEKLGRSRFLKYLEDFGFFEKTGIDLQGEVFSKNENLQQKIPRDVASASFGQAIEVTSIQLARAFTALANQGRLAKPFLVERIIFPNGQTLENSFEPGKRVISEETASKITAMLVSAVEEGYGTAAKIAGYLIAGKTGTAEIPLKKGGYVEEETVQSFVGYFPALDPQFLILIKLNNPRGATSASVSAAPMFKELAKYIIDLKQIPPDY